jgi:hypothetical protein
MRWWDSDRSLVGLKERVRAANGHTRHLEVTQNDVILPLFKHAQYMISSFFQVLEREANRTGVKEWEQVPPTAYR